LVVGKRHHRVEQKGQRAKVIIFQPAEQIGGFAVRTTALEPGMALAVKLDLHGLPGGGLRVEVVVAITETGIQPLNKLVLQEPDDFTILK